MESFDEFLGRLKEEFDENALRRDAASWQAFLGKMKPIARLARENPDVPIHIEGFEIFGCELTLTRRKG